MTGAAVAAGGHLRALRGSRSLRWLDNRLSYAVGMPILTLLGLATTLLIPRLIGPVEFGAYALLLNLSRYAARSDLGLSQLADRRIAAAAGAAELSEIDRILDVRLRLGLLTLVTLLPIAAIGAFLTGWASPVDAALAAAAGAMAMIAGGPSSIYRATGQVWEYTALAFFFSIGFTVPRLLGFLIDGTTGCFAVLLVWYVAVVAMFSLRPSRARRPRRARVPMMATLRAALPLFVFAGAWMVFLSASRWITAILSTPQDLGLFAMGSNLALTGVTTLAAIGDVRYPQWLTRLANHEAGAHSRSIEREAIAMSIVLACLVAAFVPVAGWAVHIAFPAYAAAAPSLVAFAIGCVPLAVFAWFLPVVIAYTPSPQRDAAIIFVPATVMLCLGMFAGNRIAGIEGQAWGCSVASVTTLASMALVMRRLGVLTARSAARFFAVPAALSAGLSGFAMAAGPHDPPCMIVGSGPGPAETVPPVGWRLAFEDDFSALKLWNGKSGVWEPRYAWGGRTNASAKELEYYVDPRPAREMRAMTRLNPFSIEHGHLEIAARPIPPVDRALTKGLSYASGLLNSLHGFTFTYGYIEMQASVPEGRGLWPAFWLLPVKKEWPPEIDVMEVIGSERGQYWATVHSGTIASKVEVQARVATDDLYGRLHTYALRWGPSETIWYFDGRRVASTVTPDDLHQPMYILLNLAVGGTWPGSPDARTVFPARFRIERIRVFQGPGASSGSESRP